MSTVSEKDTLAQASEHKQEQTAPITSDSAQTSQSQNFFATADSVQTPDDLTGIATTESAQAKQENIAEDKPASSVADQDAALARTEEANAESVKAQTETTFSQEAMEHEGVASVQGEKSNAQESSTPQEKALTHEAMVASVEREIAATQEQSAATPPNGPTDTSLPATNPDSEPPATKEEDEDEEGEGRMSLMDHLRELRQRLIYSLIAAFIGFLLCWTVVEPIFNVLTDPLLAVLPEGSKPIYTTLPEGFFTRMYIAFICGIFVASPAIFYQIWSFISPGLYEEEKRFLLPVAFISAIFFAAGGFFCYYIVFHYAFAFFVSYATADIAAMPKISDYLDFVLKLILAFGFIFEMPIFAFFLSRMGVVTAQSMRKGRRYAILVVFIVAAILTPPDVVSQLLMAIPMLLLYEVSIWVAALFGKKVEPKSEEEDIEEDDTEPKQSAEKS